MHMSRRTALASFLMPALAVKLHEQSASSFDDLRQLMQD